ncbi:ABC transporter permease [Catenuloplanes atrovinosus]|uniref:Transport permease protein n=1 Tax=Catenuloplanes atrovinosus TaxID=137266 RepID=A0AAE3YS01_9ACTN|nr:ABC transporter permease [Catenuloplanes atrovinosus]MDR7276696.1 ABC-2 type transport system permease protein [Catenuloplanes atrovinosus]
MTTTTVRGPAATLPSTLRIGLSRGAAEVRAYFRERDAVVFTFALPTLILVLLGYIFDEPLDGAPGTRVSQVFAAGMVAYGILSTAFISVGIGIAADREDGTLKRLRGTPATAGAYLIGKIVLVAVTTAGSVALMLATAVLLFGLDLPSDTGRWVTFGWLMALSVVACTLLGIAASTLARSARSAPAVMNLPVLALQFVSGIFVHITALPDAMLTVASWFPVKWMGQGFRSVFLPDSLAAQEVAGSWEHGRIALVLTAWCLLGLVLCLATFRWTDRRTR